MIIRLMDCKAIGYCARGTRRWFNRHGLDFNAFRKNGIPEEDLLATGDAMAIRLVELTRVRNGLPARGGDSA